MNKKIISTLSVAVLTACMFACCNKALIIKEQGSFAAGGTIANMNGTFNPQKPSDSAGQSLHADHLYAFYQIPKKAKRYPLVFLHGAGQSGKTWETTSDGREGFQNIFLRKGYSVYLADQPRRGRAGKSSVASNIVPAHDEQMWFGQFRLGVWPEFFENTQFPQDEESLNQFFRQMTPNTGAYDADIISSALAALFDKTGEAVLITHSQGGGPGWYTGIKSKNVRGIVAYEPGSGFLFPDGEVPVPMQSSYGLLSAVGIPKEDFIKLTKMPIIIYYGDNIPEAPINMPAQDYWRTCLKMANLWADTINKHGGDAKVVHLPKEGIKGNTHFMFADLNNLEVAEHLSNWLKEKGLDKR